jgi:hypothetical protein
MTFGLLNSIMLLGLFALAIPIIIHLLNRRRFDVVDWGAMRFLVMSETTRRRVFIEELLLMLLRMGLIAVLVLAMCAPIASGVIFEKLGFVENRDVVLVFDGSTAMSYTDDDGKTSHQQAVEWAKSLLDEMKPGDTVAVIQAREQPVEYPEQKPDAKRPAGAKPLPLLTSDLKQARDTLDKLVAPGGGCDWPAAVKMAGETLRKYGTHGRRDVILLGVGRVTDWADPKTLDEWVRTVPLLADGKATPRVWMVPFADKRPDELPNWAITPIRAESVGYMTDVTFRTSLRVQGQKYKVPYKFRYEIDLPPGTQRAEKDTDRLGGNIELPESDDLKDGRIPVTFPVEKVKDANRREYKRIKRLPGPGSHLISVIVEPDAPTDKRDAGAPIRDRLAGDNRRDFAVNVPLLPVLIVDPRDGEKPRVSDAIWAALGGTLQDDPKAGLLARTRIVEPTDELLQALKPQPGQEANNPLRVAVLCDVKELGESQRTALEQFVRDGGGLLVIVGPRTNRDHYNRYLYSKVTKEGDQGMVMEVIKEGEGWLPAKLDKIVGVDARTATAMDDRQAHPDGGSFNLPALSLFSETETRNDIEGARFRRWWQVVPPSPGVASVVALLKVSQPKEVKYPWLVEKQHGKGRVLLCTAPLYDPAGSVPQKDGKDAWRTNIHTLDVPGYAPLVFNLVSYLAGHRVADYSFETGQPITYDLPADERDMTQKSVLKTPRGNQVELEPKDGKIVFEDTRLPGVYVLTTPRRHTVYFTVQTATPTGFELTPWTDADRTKVANLFAKHGLEAADPAKAAAVPLAYSTDRAAILKGQDRDLWWLLLVLVTALMCGEVWTTRHIAKGR